MYKMYNTEDQGSDHERFRHLSGTATIFKFESYNIRTVLVDDDPKFVVADLCTALGISNPTMATKGIDEDDLSTTEVIDSKGRVQTPNVVNESGMYQLIFMSRKVEAKKFRRWVTSEVLPALRRTGKYEVAPSASTLEIAAQSEIDRANVARAQILMLGIAVETGLLDRSWATSKTHLIAARSIGEEPEQPDGEKPLYIPDYLKNKGITAKKDVASIQSWFGRRAVEIGEANGIDVPELRQTELPNGSIRDTRAWCRKHKPLFDEVWTTYYAARYDPPMGQLELGAA